jgi:hypothetical protein
VAVSTRGSCIMPALLATATVLNGILAGANADRLLVGIPALRKLGPLTWGAYSRHADLSPTGVVFYPTLAIGGTLLTIAEAVRTRRGDVTVAAACATAGLLMTFKAGPHMLAVRNLGNEPVPLQQRMDGFEFWSRIRGALQVGAFVACAISAARS